ncbi:MAG: heavy metal sensor histidine kinase [Deltaproteobacteria bacterium]|nr:heavy metal sensor histidine kinase [Deltaproteobacteria bacterium]
MIKSSIRFKLTVWYAAVMVLVLIFFGSTLYLTMSRALYAEVDSRIKGMAEVMASSSHTFPSHFDLAQLDMMVAENLGFKNQGKFIQIMDNTGTVGQTSVSLSPQPLPISITAIKRAANKEISFDTIKVERIKYPIRMITYPIIENGEVATILQVGTSLETLQNTLHVLFLTIIFGILASLALASLGGWFMAKKSLSPVNDITTAARAITAKNLDQRIEVANPNDEVGRLAETFNEMISRLNNSFRQINQFSSDVSHELRTPLTIMRGEMEVAMRTQRTPEEYKEVIASGLEEVERMSLMVEELLLLSKTEHGELKLNVSTVALRKLLEAIYDNATALARGKGVSISIQSNDEVYIEGDEMRLRQVLLNLVDNAIKYSPSGGEVELSLTRDKEYAHISVKDTGIGIAKEDQEKIFGRFYRVDASRSREVGGTGLGLSICKWITEGHGGKISVVSDIGKGTTFTVSLPFRH